MAKYKKLSKADIIKNLTQGTLLESTAQGIDLKSTWHVKHGVDISAISNNEKLQGGWLIIGVNDKGHLLGKTEDWLKNTEEKVANNIQQFLNPSFVCHIFGEIIEKSHVLFIEITKAEEVVYWDSKAYKLIGTTSHAMTAAEVLGLSVKLPGRDFSKLKYDGPINGSNVVDFSSKIDREDFADIGNASPKEILNVLKISDRNVAGILFGDFSVRVARYDEYGDVIDQQVKLNAYSILKDDFISEIQSWTKKVGTHLKGMSIAAIEDKPYPIKALREVLANAVAHANYYKDKGDILIEMYPDRLVVTNNCFVEAEAFVNKWLSKEHYSFNKLLMETLRVAHISDELGSGKTRIFRQMIEAGKKEPLVEFHSYKSHGSWKVTLYNNQDNVNITLLRQKIAGTYPNLDPESKQILIALVLWQDMPWSEIEKHLDQHTKKKALEILNRSESPLYLLRDLDKLTMKRWVRIAYEEGKSSKPFSSAEKRSYYDFLSHISNTYHNGYITHQKARDLIGISTSNAEKMQVTRLFEEWISQGLVEKIKRGEWRFVKKHS